MTHQPTQLPIDFEEPEPYVPQLYRGYVRAGFDFRVRAEDVVDWQEEVRLDRLEHGLVEELYGEGE